MRIGNAGRAVVATTLVIGLSFGAAAGPAAASTARATASLGPCWLHKLDFGLGEDTNVRDYVTRWRAGSVATIVQGTAPHARAWSLTLYHAQRGKMVSFYDRQLAAGAGGAFSLAIGGPKPRTGTWVDPTAGGGDGVGYLFYRVYQPSSGRSPLPTITFTARNGLPSTLSSCQGMSAELSAAIAAADKTNRSGNQNVGQTAQHKLWPNNGSPFRSWSKPIDVAALLPANNLKSVALVTQLGDPNMVYRVMLFNIGQSDLVLHGRLPLISPQAPRTGMRYMSLCVYPNDESLKPLACVNDSTLSLGAGRTYTVIVSPDQPGDNSTWLNPGDLASGTIVLRWLLPNHGAAANSCVPAFAYRQPGDTSVPALPSGC